MLVCCSQLWGGSVSSVLIALSHFKQWANIRYFCKVRNSAVEMLISLWNLWSEAIKKSIEYCWCVLFENWLYSLRNKKCSSWPAVSINDENVARLLQLWLDSCEITEQTANQIGISYRSFQNILKENLSVLCVCVCVCLCSWHGKRKWTILTACFLLQHVLSSTVLLYIFPCRCKVIEMQVSEKSYF
jgi:hypothetical protein